MKFCYGSLLLILFVSCSIFDEQNSQKIELHRTWELTDFVDNNGEEIPLFDYEVHTLRFEGNESEIKGEAACNYYGGKYLALKNGKLTIDEFAVTEALCRQPSSGDEYIDALVKVKKFARKGGKLILFYGTNGKLTFTERLE